ncbi:uncharacterized protein LOC132260655 [Phlebotomus argentipes]|uniref:uncharacterized protein LOC132260655 n=1 Tax=Phlebotomus argentipes TaxID=94469 RepID=UPI002893120A|nr:uncharacterized protein LOC132260655 [Phlebotomus argentipes]XP_059614912.1 uncharacterized protein LOC132260655 [Phlebotomus argentipes]
MSYKAEEDYTWLLTAEYLVQILMKNDMNLYEKYQMKAQLTNTDKNNLARLIISAVLAENYRLELPRNAMFYLCKVITEVFPKEDPSVYFTPQCGSIVPHSKGKLYHAYHLYRSKLREHGYLEKSNVPRRKRRRRL